MTRLINLFLVFGLCSILAVGGGTAVLPAMEHMTVHTHHWLTEAQFRNDYSIGQVAPGPNMLMVLLIGYQLAGWLGVAVVTIAFFAPTCVLTLFANRWWVRMAGWPWRVSIQRGLAPLAIGLMMSGTYAIAKLAIVDLPALAIAAVVLAILLWRHVNPGVLVLAGGALYLLLPH
ncbi:MAG: chromate transporter [Candidatus Binataceae bacterium]